MPGTQGLVDGTDSLDQEMGDRELQVSVEGRGILEAADETGADVDVGTKRGEEVNDIGRNPGIVPSG